MAATHLESEDHRWTIQIGDHAKRADSPGYLRSRKLMVELVKLCQPWAFGEPPYQDHHGGGIWLRDAKGWFLLLGLLGGEWSSQFCADPAKVDLWRIRTKRVVDAFPDSVEGYEGLGYAEGRALLDGAIADAAGVAAWFDGIFNASVPLPAPSHTGTLSHGQDAGYHHFPKPIVDIQFFKRDDFRLFVKDAEGRPAAVVPVAPRGSGDGRVQLIHATPGSPLHKRLQAAHKKGEAVVLPASHHMARSAFSKQR